MVDLLRKQTPWWSRSGTALAADGTPLAFAAGGPVPSPKITGDLPAIMAVANLGITAE